jgi:hypothetical protein
MVNRHILEQSKEQSQKQQKKLELEGKNETTKVWNWR